MARSNPPDQIAWLLHEGDEELFLNVGQRMTVDDRHWRATIERIEVSPGIRVHLTSAEIKRELSVEPHQQEPEPWALSHLAVKGRVRVKLSDGPSAVLAPNRSLLFRAASRRAQFCPPPGQTLRLVGFMIRHDRVRTIFGGEVPALIEPLIDPAVDVSSMIEVPADAGIRRLAASLFSNSLKGDLRRIFIEGSVLQLFAMQVAHVTSGRVRRGLSPSEREAVRAARKCLAAEMRSPPSLVELAARVGVSESTLTAGFRALYGGTVYEVLRDERLEHARIALETTDLPIKQIAFRVGYSHVTNFINAFSARYGAPPRRYTRQRISSADEAHDTDSRL